MPHALSETTTGVLSVTEIDKAIDTLNKLKLQLLSSLPRVHSVWGNVNNPMSWKLVQRVNAGRIMHRSFLTGDNITASYAMWNDLVVRDTYTDITALVGNK